MRLSLLVISVLTATMLMACSGKSNNEGAMAPGQGSSDNGTHKEHPTTPNPNEGSSGE
jgi:hypothetical protein